jgi:hypothetical protein
MTTIIDTRDPRAVAAVEAIHAGDLPRLKGILAQIAFSIVPRTARIEPETISDQRRQAR